ncbi:dynein axonemal intermediate chain 3-like [Spodoptera frugiperda]|uniref:Dynein axonemal intermediate chain 3-like n=1 Tax=Spodoptera frugiperda TaxID=7108 RepID=A0A9R0D3I1_SPOFR|nr:dynein axonemal intermediate chain 3-like [Spodoptera frugiperda]
MFGESEDSSDEEVPPEPKRSSSSEGGYEEDDDDNISEVEEVKKVPAPAPTEEEKQAETLVQAVQTEEAKMSTGAVGPQPRRKRFIPKYNVEGVHVLTIGEDTQTQIEMVVGVQVYAQYPWKTVQKSKLIESIEIGGELSEFFPLRKEIEEYPEAEILMGYIVDESSNTDDFYICCTIEARDHCKQQSDRFIRRQEKKLEKAIQKKPRPWVSLGSEIEITELEPINSRTLMEIEIKAKFPTEYEPIKFTVRDTEAVRDGIIELTAYRQRFNNVTRRRIDCACQIRPVSVSQVAQTYLKFPQNKWTQSIADAMGRIGDEGGDGDRERDDDDSSDEEYTSKKHPIDEVGLRSYRAAAARMRRPSYQKLINKFMTSRVAEMESIIELNAVMDMYYNDYPNLVTQKHIDTLGTMAFEEYVCFTDVRAKFKYVSCAEFHPMWSGIVAISYSDVSPTVMRTHTFTRNDPIQRAVYGLNPVLIWSHIDSLRSKLYLESPREVTTLSFCPFNENVLIGGLINGQVVIWDLTKKLENVEKIEVLSETREKYRIAMNSQMGWMKSIQDRAVVNATACSSLLNCHEAAVSAIKWVPPTFVITPTGKTVRLPENKYSLQFITTSVDGKILVWNISVGDMAFVEGKKVKKSKRIARRPSGLLVDVSPFQVLDRILQPCYKIVLGIAGQPWAYSIQSFGISAPNVKYIYTPKNNGTGRKYFTCEVDKETRETMNSIFYFGTKHGELTRATWEGHEFNTGEVVNSEFADIKYRCNLHDGAIVVTSKNPIMDSVTLTVGGKIFAIWSDYLQGRPIIWKKRPYRLTDGVWSQYKPSIIFICNSEGDLETWDLLIKSDKPISVQTLAGSMLTKVSLHTLPLVKNIIGVSDVNGSFRMFLNPPVFMLSKANYTPRMEAMVERELKVMKSFIEWQKNFMQKNPHILLEIKRKEGALLAEKEEEKRRKREELEKLQDEEDEARRLERMKVLGPEERWQKIIQKLIERTIAVKKRINRALLIEHEKPLRELEAQRLEKERRMLEIMKNQKTIFNDTVAILFPEAIQKPFKPKKSLLSDNKEALKREYLAEYYYIRGTAKTMVRKNPYKADFRYEATVAEGKERRGALNAQQSYVKRHYFRIEHEHQRHTTTVPVKKIAKMKEKTEEEEEEAAAEEREVEGQLGGEPTN